MSVRTIADEHIDLAEESVKTAAKALGEVCINECCGADEYSDKRLTELRECLNELLSIKDRLKR